MRCRDSHLQHAKKILSQIHILRNQHCEDMGWNTKSGKSNTSSSKVPAAAPAADAPAVTEPSTPKAIPKKQSAPSAPKKPAPAPKKKVLLETEDAEDTKAAVAPVKASKASSVSEKKSNVVPDIDEDNDDDDDEAINPFSDGASVAYANLAAADLAAEQNLDDEDEATLKSIDKAADAVASSSSAKATKAKPKSKKAAAAEESEKKPTKKRKREETAEKPAPEKAAPRPKGPPPARVAKEPAPAPAKKAGAKKTGKKTGAAASESKKQAKDETSAEEEKPVKAKRAVKTKEERKQIAEARKEKIGLLNSSIDADNPMKLLRQNFCGAEQVGAKKGGFVAKEVAALYYLHRQEWDGATRTEQAQSDFLPMYEMVREDRELTEKFTAGKARSFNAFNAKMSDLAYATVSYETLQGAEALRYKYNRKKNEGTLIGSKQSMQAASEDIGTFLEVVRRINNVDTRNLPHAVAAEITTFQTSLRNTCQLNTRKLTEAEIQSGQDEFVKIPLIAAINAFLVISNSPALCAVLNGEDIDAMQQDEDDDAAEEAGEDDAGEEEEDESGEEPVAQPTKKQKKA